MISYIFRFLLLLIADCIILFSVNSTITQVLNALGLSEIVSFIAGIVVIAATLVYMNMRPSFRSNIIWKNK